MHLDAPAVRAREGPLRLRPQRSSPFGQPASKGETHLVCLRWLACMSAKGKVVADERVVDPSGSIEPALKVLRVTFIYTCPAPFRQPHEHQVSNEIALAQIHSSGMEALAHQLPIIAASIEKRLDNPQAADCEVDQIGRSPRFSR